MAAFFMVSHRKGAEYAKKDFRYLLTAEARRRREKIFFCRKARKNAQNQKTIIKLSLRSSRFLRQKIF